MFWCFCGESIKNVELPSVLNNFKEEKIEIKVEEVRVEVEEKKKEEDIKKEEEIKEEVEKIIEEIIKIEEKKEEEIKIEVEVNVKEEEIKKEEKEIKKEEEEKKVKEEEDQSIDIILNEIKDVIDIKNNLIKIINNMQIKINKKLKINKCECKIYNLTKNKYHIVLEEPYNMIIILEDILEIKELLNMNEYINKSFNYIYIDKHWITECYKVLNDIKIIEIKKILLKDNISNINFLEELNYEIIVENKQDNISNISNSNVIVNTIFDPSTVFLNQDLQIRNDDILPNQPN
jgi:hypothetical protein